MVEDDEGRAVVGSGGLGLAVAACNFDFYLYVIEPAAGSASGTSSTTSTSGATGGAGGTAGSGGTGTGGGEDAGPTSPLWAKQFGDAAGQIGRVVATDPLGNVIVAGLSLDGAVDFGGGATPTQNVAIVVAKFDTAGAYAWSKTCLYDAGSTVSTPTPLAMTVDGAGNTILVGSVNGTINCGCGDLTSPPGQAATFLLELDQHGTCTLALPIDYMVAETIAVDSQDDLVVAGSFSGLLEMGCGMLTSPAGGGTVVARLTHAGGCIWNYAYGATVNPSIAVDAMDDVILTGSFSGTLDFGNGPMTSIGSSDMFLVAFDSTGSYGWSGSWGNAGTTIAPSGIAVDHAGRIVVAGQLWGSVDVGAAMLTSADGAGSFAAGFDASGHPQWGASFGPMEVNGALPSPAVAVDAAGNVWLTGNMVSTASFGGGTLTSAGGTDAFVARLDPSGGYLWAQNFGDAQDQSGTGVATDRKGNAFVVGAFAGSMGFGATTLTSAGNPNIFLAKFSP